MLPWTFLAPSQLASKLQQASKEVLTIYRLIYNNQIINHWNCYNLEMYWEIMQFINEFIRLYTKLYIYSLLIDINLANLEFIKFIKLIEFNK